MDTRPDKDQEKRRNLSQWVSDRAGEEGLRDGAATHNQTRWPTISRSMGSNTFSQVRSPTAKPPVCIGQNERRHKETN